MIGRALTWWGSTLAACIPQGISRALEPRRRAIEWDEKIGGVSAKKLSSQIRGWRSQHLKVHLPSTLAPCRKISLPHAAAKQVDQALMLQIDCLTPFQASDVFVGSRVAEHIESEGRILVECAVTPRNAVERIRERVARYGGRVVEVVSTSASPALTIWERPVKKISYAPALAFFGIAIGLVSGVALERISALTDQRDLLEGRINLERREAIHSQSARRSFEDVFAEAAFVENRLHSNGSRREVINEIAKRLRNDTWLASLSLEGNAVRLSGFSTSPQSLIALLESSPKLTNVTFESSTIRDSRFRADRLELGAEIVRPLRRRN